MIENNFDAFYAWRRMLFCKGAACLFLVFVVKVFCIEQKVTVYGE